MSNPDETPPSLLEDAALRLLLSVSERNARTGKSPDVLIWRKRYKELEASFEHKYPGVLAERRRKLTEHG